MSNIQIYDVGFSSFIKIQRLCWFYLYLGPSIYQWLLSQDHLGIKYWNKDFFSTKTEIVLALQSCQLIYNFLVSYHCSYQYFSSRSILWTKVDPYGKDCLFQNVRKHEIKRKWNSRTDSRVQLHVVVCTFVSHCRIFLYLTVISIWAYWKPLILLPKEAYMNI